MEKVDIKKGLLGAVILVIAGFVPLAYGNDSVISFYPIYGNTNVGDNAFAWRDISAFAVTYGITSLLSIYFLLKKQHVGIFIVISLNAVAALFSLAGMAMLALRASQLDDLSFTFSYGWIFVIIGIVLVILDGVRIRKLRLQEKENLQ